MKIDPKHAIRDLKAFLECWLGTLPPEYGIPPDEIPDYLPLPLRELYSWAGQCPHQRNHDDRLFLPGRQPRLFQEQDCLSSIDSLELKGERLVFLSESQDNWTCETLISHDDPPVYSNVAHVWDETAREPEEVCSRLSHFLTTFCLQEVVFGSRYVLTYDDEYDSPASFVREPIHAVWLNGQYVFKEPTHSFFLCQQKLLIMEMYHTIFFAYNDPFAKSFMLNVDTMRVLNETW